VLFVVGICCLVITFLKSPQVPEPSTFR